MKSVWLPLILLLSFFLRFVALTDYPVGFNADEASFGYDAYSILKTGADQWGQVLPLTLQSFGDYKSPLYAYFAAPSVAIFGLNIFATRLPNVIVGTLAVYIVWLLSSELKKRLKIKFNIEIIAITLFAVSPWSVMLSRGAFEANLITLFLPLGVYLYLKRKYKLAALVFGLSLFTYHSAKVISPLLFFGLTCTVKRKNIVSIAVYLVFLTLSIWTIMSGGGVRITERSITQGALEEGARKKIELIQAGKNPIISKIMHNKYQVTMSRFVQNYTQYFSPRFLFSQGAGEYYYGMIHGIGVIYLTEAILILGLIKLYKDKKFQKILLFLIFWLLITPLPAALSTGVGYSGHRAVGMIPVIQILASIGGYGFYLYFKRKNDKLKNIFIFVTTLLLIVNIYKFMNIYFKNTPKDAYSQMLYGNLEVAAWLLHNNNEKPILISRSLSEPQIFLAFEQKLNPQIFQNESKKWHVTTWVDQIPEYSLKNYTIKSIDWQKDIQKEGTLIIAKASEFPKNIIPDAVFDLPDGSPNIYAKSF